MAPVGARAIYQACLDAASRAAFTGDLCALLTAFAIPSQIATADRSIVLTSPEELDLAMQDYVERLAENGVSDEHEVCDAAEFVPGMPDMIAGRHVTEWTHADGRPPRRFANRMILMRYPEGWRIMWLQSDLSCDEVEMLSADWVAAQARTLNHISGGRH